MREKYELIDRTLESNKNVLTVSYLCQSAGVSRSGYYSWKKRKNDPLSVYNKKEEQDRKDFDLILEAYNFKGYDKGRRGIHMRLLRMGIIMNHKKISRLMDKFNLFCPIRKANPIRRMAKVSIPWWRSHPIHENRATESIWTEPCNPLLRATKSTKRATSA